MRNSEQQSVIRSSNWWRKRLDLNRVLIIFYFAILSVSSSEAQNYNSEINHAIKNEMAPYPLRASVNVYSSKENRIVDSTSNYKNGCLTPECIHTASRILEYMNSSADPCDNFYKFACGKFLETTVIPNEDSSLDQMDLIFKKVEQQLKNILEEESKPDEPRHVKLVKAMYQNCMNETAINEKSLQTALHFLNKLDRWPVMEGNSWNDKDFEWEELIYKVQKESGLTIGFFNLEITEDTKNSSKRMLLISQPSLFVSRKNLIKGFSDSIVKAYYNYMVEISVIFGANRTQAEKDSKQLLEFEIKLANISVPQEERRITADSFSAMTIKELQGNYSNIPWKKYLNEFLSPFADIGEDEAVLMQDTSFFIEFDKLIKHIPKRVQANYIMWNVVDDMVDYLNDDVQREYLKLKTAINGQKEAGPRWKKCVSDTRAELKQSLDALYVKKYFNKDSKKAIGEMVKNIRQEVKKIIQSVDWMDHKTKASALEKLKSMGQVIAYADELLDDKEVDKFYANLEITADNYLLSSLNVTQFYRNRDLSEFRKPINKTSWLSNEGPTDVNSAYSLAENKIELSASILQELFFNNDRPRYMNYGAIGFVIGHELTHGFDDEGRNYDKEGNLVDWWQTESEEKFLLKSKCIIYQYGNYTAEEVGLNLNGINTQGENIADNGGIKAAYLAYQEWVERNDPEPTLHGLDYTPSQLFWISTAQSWCGKMRPEALKNSILNDEHSPNEFRLLGSLSNRPEFAKDFKCAEGTRMNPKEKCSVW